MIFSLWNHRSQRPGAKHSGRGELVRDRLVRPPRFLLRQTPQLIRHADVVFGPGFSPYKALPAIQTVGQRSRRTQRVLGPHGRPSSGGHARVIERVGFAPHVAGSAGVGTVELVTRVSRRCDFDVGGGCLDVDGDDFDRYASGGVEECITRSMDLRSEPL